MNVLIIDDDAEDRLLFCEALNELFPHVNCSGVSDCDHLREVINHTKPDIIFIDGHMHPKNGPECLREVLGIIDRRRISTVIHSGSLSPEELDEFRSAGADHILIKASSFGELKSNIRSMLEKCELVKPAAEG